MEGKFLRLAEVNPRVVKLTKNYMSNKFYLACHSQSKTEECNCIVKIYFQGHSFNIDMTMIRSDSYLVI